MDFVGLIEQRFLPRLREAGEQIAREFPAVAVKVCSYEGGQLTKNLAHAFAIDCNLRAPQSENDNVGLIILLEHLREQPTIRADVIWGAPSGSTEFEVYEDEMLVSEEVLTEIEDKLPLMINTLKSALARGKPSNE
jgi:hypothetical protein